MKFTDNETKLLKTLIKSSTFNGDCFDLTKPWEEQRLENSDEWLEIIDLNYYGSILNMDKEGTRGVLGSLSKKGVIKVLKDEVNGAPIWWLAIDEDGFNKIKEAFAHPKKTTKINELTKSTKAPEKWNWFHAPTKSDAMTFQIKKALQAGRTKESLMEEFKSLGVQWKEESNSGINCMRACMAMKEYLFKLA